MNTEYLSKVRALLDHVEQNVLPEIEKVAKVCAQTVARDGMLYFFGTGHSHMIAEEPFYRAGGLANIAPILKNFLMLHENATESSLFERIPGIGDSIIENCGIKPGDVLFIISNSGRNSGGIDAALRASQMGVTTVAITNLHHSSAVTSRHPSGKKLYEVCDYVLDNGGAVGDACVSLPGMPGDQKIAPTSTVIDATIVNLLMSAICEELIGKGIAPNVFISANTDEGDAHNAAIIEKYKKRVPFL